MAELLGPLPALGPAGAGWGLVLPFAGGSAVMIWYLRSRAIGLGSLFRSSLGTQPPRLVPLF
jgi:hypothetical protein